MDNGASSYRRFLDGDDNGITEIVENYKDGLILYLNGYVKNIASCSTPRDSLRVSRPSIAGSVAQASSIWRLRGSSPPMGL